MADENKNEKKPEPPKPDINLIAMVKKSRSQEESDD
jgi:hypothetical protein